MNREDVDFLSFAATVPIVFRCAEERLAPNRALSRGQTEPVLVATRASVNSLNIGQCDKLQFTGTPQSRHGREIQGRHERSPNSAFRSGEGPGSTRTNLRPSAKYNYQCLREHIPSFNGIRALAFLSVFAVHTRSFITSPAWP